MIILHTVMIRYSLLLEKSKSWKLASNDTDVYRNNLFNEVRLSEREQLFRQLALPSLESQTILNDSCKASNLTNPENHSRVEYQVFVATSEELPQHHKEKLEAITQDMPWLNINYLPTKGVKFESVVTNYVEKLYKETQETILYSSVRLDDDDILSNRFFEYLSKYTTVENVGNVITLANGYAGFYDFEKSAYSEIYDYFYPMVAMGLAYISKFDQNGYADDSVRTIFSTGSHTRVNRKFPLITDGRKPSYIRTLYEGSDSHDIKRASNIRKNQLQIHPIKAMQDMGIPFPVLFADQQINISKIDLENIEVIDIDLSNSNTGSIAIIQVCIKDNKLLIQVCKCIQTEYTFEFDISLNTEILPNSTKLISPHKQMIVNLTNNIEEYVNSSKALSEFNRSLVLTIKFKHNGDSISENIKLF